jgi:hypothetical protein
MMRGVADILMKETVEIVAEGAMKAMRTTKVMTTTANRDRQPGNPGWFGLKRLLNFLKDGFHEIKHH